MDKEDKASLTPIHNNSNVLLSWFTKKEDLELESLSNEEIIDGLSATIYIWVLTQQGNGFGWSAIQQGLKEKMGNDPLFLRSYSYVTVGFEECEDEGYTVQLPLLQILFAGEATHRIHYSTTHGCIY
ncbi:Probable polyamine oxidase 5 [Linum grandiflorum]